MDTQDLTLFAEVAREGSFAAVARRRGMDPSVVSRTIAALEDRMGLRLFQRSTRRLSLTEAGALALARMVPLLEELERVGAELRDATRGEPRGTLRLTAAVSFGQHVIVPRLARFRAAYPGIAVEGVFTDTTLDLVAERMDLAIRLAPAVDGDLVVAKLMDTRYRVVAGPGYLAGAPPLAVPGDLSRHRALLYQNRPYRTRWLFRDGAGRVTEQPVAGDLVLTPASTVRDACLAGLGPALLPDWLVDGDIAAGRLVHCLAAWTVTATVFDTAAWIVYPSRSFLPAKTRAMIDFLRAELTGSDRAVAAVSA